jgi:hypothetical protein
MAVENVNHGGWAYPVDPAEVVTASGTLTRADKGGVVVLNNSSGAMTVRFPQPNVPGARYTVHNVSTGTLGAHTLSLPTSNTWDGTNGTVAIAPRASYELISVGSQEWRVQPLRDGFVRHTPAATYAPPLLPAGARMTIVLGQTAGTVNITLPTLVAALNDGARYTIVSEGTLQHVLSAGAGRIGNGSATFTLGTLALQSLELVAANGTYRPVSLSANTYNGTIA